MCSGSWLPFIALHLSVNVILVLWFTDVNLGLHHLGVHEGLHRLVRCGRQWGLLNWLFRDWLPNDWGAKARFCQGVILVWVRGLFFANDSCFLEVAISITLKTKTSQSSVLYKFQFRLICCRFWCFFLLLFFHNLSSNCQPGRLLVQHVLFDNQVFSHIVGIWWWHSFLYSQYVIEVMSWLDLLVNSKHDGLIDIMMP
jgi:hypothetical protein